MPGTVNSGEDLEATHLAAAKHAGEAELFRLPYHQRRLHQKRCQKTCEEYLVAREAHPLLLFQNKNLLKVLGSAQTLLPSLLHCEGAADPGYSARRAQNCRATLHRSPS
ncbi:hypothetical protein S245_062877 [Arachis hypogaea]